MVNTRSTLHRLEEQRKRDQELSGSKENVANVQEDMKEGVKLFEVPTDRTKEKVLPAAGRVKTTSEVLDNLHKPSTSGSQTKSLIKPKSKCTFSSSSSSKSVRRKELMIQAAEERARIQMELVDQKLAYDLANLDEEYSSQSEVESDRNSEIEKWMDRSQPDTRLVSQAGISRNAKCDPPLLPPLPTSQPPLAARRRPAPPPVTQPPPYAYLAGTPPAPHAAGDTSGTLYLLSSVLKDLAVATAAKATNEPDPTMLSRLCTPRDLPSFSGDCMEWLQFKQAYEESSKVCNFSDQENLWRLRKCLHGPAKEAVVALLIGATSPQTLMSTLELQFGNPDVIVTRIMQDINNLQPMSPDYHREIIPFAVKVKNCVAAVLAVGQGDYLYGMSVVSLILSKLPTVLLSKWSDYSFTVSQKHISKLEILSEFLSEEAMKMTTSGILLAYASTTLPTKRKNNDDSRHRPQVMLNDQCIELMCGFCRKSKHKLPDCRMFKKSLRKVRWQYVKHHCICYKCLMSNHSRETCAAPVCDKDNCAGLHHPLLHYDTNLNTNMQPNVNLVHSSDVETPLEAVTHVKVSSAKVLLKTISVNIHGPNGVVPTVALLDDGSTVSLISAELARRAGLHGRKQKMYVCGAWNNNTIECDSELVDLQLSNKDGTIFSIRARSVDKLNLPAQNVLQDITMDAALLRRFSDHLCYGYVKPEILIGQDLYDLMLPMEIVKVNENGTYLTRTPLGWCVHGCARGCTSAGASPTSLPGSEVPAENPEKENELNVKRSLYGRQSDEHDVNLEQVNIIHVVHDDLKSQSFLEDLEHLKNKKVVRIKRKIRPQPPRMGDLPTCCQNGPPTAPIFTSAWWTGTKTGMLRRPVSRLARIPVEDEVLTSTAGGHVSDA